MNRTLYVTDLDGTLLDSNSRISPKSTEIINDLIGRGMFFTYATARSLVSASVVTKGLLMNIPAILFNGTFIIQPSTGRILSKEAFAPGGIERVIDVLEEHGITPMVYAYVDGVERLSWIPERENEGIRNYLGRRAGDRRLRPVNTREELYRGEIFYFNCIGDRNMLQPSYDILAQDERFRCFIQQELYRPDTENFFEIMPAAATKARAVQKLKKIWECDRVVSFGDAVNDIPMFEISDECYAVKNAVAELKAAATGTIGGNDEDGVALWLKEHVRLS